MNLDKTSALVSLENVHSSCLNGLKFEKQITGNDPSKAMTSLHALLKGYKNWMILR